AEKGIHGGIRQDGGPEGHHDATTAVSDCPGFVGSRWIRRRNRLFETMYLRRIKGVVRPVRGQEFETLVKLCNMFPACALWKCKTMHRVRFSGQMWPRCRLTDLT